MGDAGSTTLGFLAAALMLWGQRDGLFPFWIGVLVFSPFIVDATLTLVSALVAWVGAYVAFVRAINWLEARRLRQPPESSH